MKDLLKILKENKIVNVDFRFTDTLGTWHHMTFHADAVDKSVIEEGIFFDGSSIPGWRSIEKSDMLLKPDLSSGVLDPFSLYPTWILFCHVFDPVMRQPYTRDPRSIAQKAEAYLKNSNVAEVAYFGPEPEYFVFDEVYYEATPFRASYHFSSIERDDLDSLGYRHGHRPLKAGGYCPVGPRDPYADLRAETLEMLKKVGIRVLKHHHEVAQAQHELGFDKDQLLKTADHLQLYKYIVLNTAQKHGKTATFMPKPVFGESGSGMHVHQSLWKEGKPLFAGKLYEGLSETALYYIGGILAHARALNAFTNPTTNSYKRLVPGYEAPVYLAYSAGNRSAAIRIPYTENSKAKRVEIRFPDPSANPYLALSAMLMAGLDGIKNKIHPGEALDKNLYELTSKEIKPSFLMCRNLSEALKALDGDRNFLKQGNVFEEDQIDAYIELKQREIEEIDRWPHPAEFELYYSC